MKNDAQNPPCQLYLVTPPEIDLGRFKNDLLQAFSGGPVACLQLRLKGADDRAILKAADVLMPICAQHDAAFVMNDRADLAKMCGADAVHLGQSDGLVSDARELLGFDVAIGVTCHGSKHLALVAGEQGADYVAFGAFYPSSTKEPPTMAALDVLEWWSAIAELPCAAIGGLTPENCASVVHAGADFVAASHAIWAHPEGAETGVKAFNEAIEAALSSKQPVNLTD